MSKGEVISMNFTMGFPLMSQRHNSILAIVDKLTKRTHFNLVRETCDVTYVEQVFIMRLYVNTGFLRISSWIDNLNLHLGFGQVFIQHWELS